MTQPDIAPASEAVPPKKCRRTTTTLIIMVVWSAPHSPRNHFKLLRQDGLDQATPPHRARGGPHLPGIDLSDGGPRNGPPLREAVNRLFVSLRIIAVIRSVPLAVVQVDAHPERGVREPDVVPHDMERVAPPRVPLHPDVDQDLLQVQADLEAELALLFDRGVTR